MNADPRHRICRGGRILSGEQGTAHGAKVADFLAEVILGDLKAGGEAGEAEEFRGSAIDQLLCQADLVRVKRLSATAAQRFGLPGDGGCLGCRFFVE